MFPIKHLGGIIPLGAIGSWTTISKIQPNPLIRLTGIGEYGPLIKVTIPIEMSFIMCLYKSGITCLKGDFQETKK
jgi:hypothetical protein